MLDNCTVHFSDVILIKGDLWKRSVGSSFPKGFSFELHPVYGRAEEGFIRIKPTNQLPVLCFSPSGIECFPKSPKLNSVQCNICFIIVISSQKGIVIAMTSLHSY